MEKFYLNKYKGRQIKRKCEKLAFVKPFCDATHSLCNNFELLCERVIWDRESAHWATQKRKPLGNGTKTSLGDTWDLISTRTYERTTNDQQITTSGLLLGSSGILVMSQQYFSHHSFFCMSFQRLFQSTEASFQ